MTRATAVALAAAAAAALGTSACPRRATPTPKVPPPPANVGAEAPPLELALETLDRVPVLLSALRSRYTVVCLFTTGSDDTLLYVDTLNRLDADWTPYGVRVLGISLDASVELVPPFVEGAGMRFPVYLATLPLRAGASPLGPISAVPLTLVLDGAGRPRHHHYGATPLATLEAELDALRRESAPR